MKPISLFYYRRNNALKNFGDDLSPELLNYVTGRQVIWASEYDCDVFGVGSILHRTLKFDYNLRRALKRRKPAVVWGSGIAERPKNRGNPNFVVAALRGKLSADIFAAPDVALGDPALLVGEWFQERKKTHFLGVIPHYSDENHESVDTFCERNDHVLRISVEKEPLEVVRDISRCEVIVSSSLHGLIVADALGIPNFKVTFAGGIRGGRFKFDDYVSAIGREKLEDIDLSTFDPDFALSRYDQTYFDHVESAASKLTAALNKHI